MADQSASLPPILPPAAGSSRPLHPSPSRDGLALEVLSQRERENWGHVVGRDVPLDSLLVPLGWGEWELIGL